VKWGYNKDKGNKDRNKDRDNDREEVQVAAL
jgi:hypothetical protein